MVLSWGAAGGGGRAEAAAAAVAAPEAEAVTEEAPERMGFRAGRTCIRVYGDIVEFSTDSDSGKHTRKQTRMVSRLTLIESTGKMAACSEMPA